MEKIFTDQMNQTIRLENIPRRIVSLVPSQTELLYDLGLEEEVVGITKFCIHPAIWFQTKKRVGGTKKLNIEAIRSLQPDLIIGNKEENTKSDYTALQEIAPVWMSDILNLDDSYNMILQLGALVGKVQKSEEITAKIRSEFELLPKNETPKSVLYFIWQKPYFVAGKNTFIDSLLEACSFENACKKARYPIYNSEDSLKPDFIFLSSEPFPFKAKHVAEMQELFPAAQVLIVDGEFFSWYGSRMLYAPTYFRKLIQQLTNK
jgi:ABC-type Fe3+-hydroxamate transport system substrate-binding protein